MGQHLPQHLLAQEPTMSLSTLTEWVPQQGAFTEWSCSSKCQHCGKPGKGHSVLWKQRDMHHAPISHVLWSLADCGEWASKWSLSELPIGKGLALAELLQFCICPCLSRAPVPALFPGDLFELQSQQCSLSQSVCSGCTTTSH
jgi:hypothetical protein